MAQLLAQYPRTPTGMNNGFLRVFQLNRLQATIPNINNHTSHNHFKPFNLHAILNSLIRIQSPNQSTLQPRNPKSKPQTC